MGSTIRPMQNAARDQIGEDLVGNTGSKLSPIILFAEPNQLRDFRLCSGFAEQLAAVQFNAHDFRIASRGLVRIHADEFEIVDQDSAQLFAQFALQAFDRRFTGLAAPAGQDQQGSGVLLAAQQNLFVSNGEESDFVVVDLVEAMHVLLQNRQLEIVGRDEEAAFRGAVACDLF